MPTRAPIKTRIIKAWKQAIDKDYDNRRINSERSLQASFWSHLNQLIPKSQRLFIEPSFSIPLEGGIKKVTPDIVITNSREVIAVIELKYQPRLKPAYEKDLQTLTLLAKHRTKIELKHNRYRGKCSEHESYPLSNKILFAWAGVHAKESTPTKHPYSHGRRPLRDCYLELHAATSQHAHPAIFHLS